MKKSTFFALVALQLAFLGLIGARYGYVLLTGEPIKMRVEAVDPMDYFRGQYVALGYPISAWTGAVSGDTGRGARVYLSLNTSSSGIIDRVNSVHAAYADCQGICVGAQIMARERRQRIVVRYTYLNASGATVEKPSEEFTQTVYDYGNAYATSEFHEGEEVRVDAYGTGIISAVYKVDPNVTSLDYSKMSYDFSKPNGQILKVLGTENLLRFQIDANRFYVKQGTGIPLEQRIRDSVVYANIRVGAGGKTVLESLDDNGNILR